MVAKGTVITAALYNSLQTQVATVLGKGNSLNTDYDPANPKFGYNQPVQSPYLVVNPTTGVFPAISAPNHWALLKTDILTCATHQNSDVSTLTSLAITAGIVITNTDIDPFTTAVATIVANRTVQPPSNQYTISTLNTSSWALEWKTQIYNTLTVNWPTAADMRAFFNAGGSIKFSATRSNSSGSLQDTAWTTLISNLGTITFDVNGIRGSVGTGSSIGPYSLTNAYGSIPIYTYTGGVTYGGNDYSIFALCNQTSNATGTASNITFKIVFNDDSKATGTQFDNVTGTFTSTTSCLRPSGSYVNTVLPTASGISFTGG
jgi:hypothetical protein